VICIQYKTASKRR